MAAKAANHVVSAKRLEDGEAVTVYRTIGIRDQRDFDPFLIMDEIQVDEDTGFFDHPHRGFIKLAYISSGSLVHEDFMGNKSLLEPGSIYCMTAGKGIVHCETGSPVATGFHFWINLPKKHKMIEPKYELTPASSVKAVKQNRSVVKILIGESCGVQAEITPLTPSMILDISIMENGSCEIPVPEGWNSTAYVFNGCLKTGSTESPTLVERRNSVFFEQNGSLVKMWNTENDTCQVIFMAGGKIDETLAKRGPYIMTSEGELNQAVEDYENFENGFEKAENWVSEAKKLFDGGEE